MTFTWVKKVNDHKTAMSNVAIDLLLRVAKAAVSKATGSETERPHARLG